MPPAEAVSSVREQAASQPPHIDGKPPKARGSLQRKQDTVRFRRKERRQDGGTAIKSTVQDNPATGGRGGEQFGLPNRRSDTRVSTRATGDHTRIEALSGNFCNGILLFKIEKSHFNSAWSGPAIRPGLVQTFVGPWKDRDIAVLPRICSRRNALLESIVNNSGYLYRQFHSRTKSASFDSQMYVSGWLLCCLEPKYLQDPLHHVVSGPDQGDVFRQDLIHYSGS